MVQTKQKKEGSLFSVLASGVAATAMGLLIGFSSEAARLPEFVRAGQPEESRNSHYSPVLRLGDTNNSENWRRLFRAPDRHATPTLALQEADLNSIADQYFNFSLGKEQAMPNGTTPSYALVPETPNFAITGDTLQIVIPFEVIFFGSEGDAFLTATGKFKEEAKKPSYKVEEAWINSARVPPFVGKIILGKLARTVLDSSADSPLASAWSRLESVEIKDDEMILGLQ